MPARGDYLEGQSLRDDMRFLHRLLGVETELTEAQLQRVQSKGTQKNMIALIASLLGGKAATPGPTSADLSREDTAYWQKILDDGEFARKVGAVLGPGGTSHIKKTARAILGKRTPDQISAYLRSQGLEPGTAKKGGQRLETLVAAVIKEPEKLPEAEQSIRGMFPALPKETLREGKTEAGESVPDVILKARSKAEGLKLEEKALAVVRQAAATRGIPKAGPGGYSGKLLPAVPQTTVGEVGAAEAMARSPGKRYPVVAAGPKQPRGPAESVEQGRKVSVKEVAHTAATAGAGPRRAEALNVMDKFFKGVGGKGTVDPRVLAALGIPAALIAKIAQAGKGGAAAATPTAGTTGGVTMPLGPRTVPPARGGGGLLEQLLGGGPIPSAAETVSASRQASLARGMGTMPTGPAGLAAAMAGGAGGGIPGVPPKTSPWMALFSKKGIGMVGGGLILGLLVSHLMDRMMGPSDIRTAGQLRMAQMPPPELQAQQAMMPGAMAQNQMLSQMLMAQMMGGGGGGGGQRLSPYEIGR